MTYKIEELESIHFFVEDLEIKLLDQQHKCTHPVQFIITISNRGIKSKKCSVCSKVWELQ